VKQEVEDMEKENSWLLLFDDECSYALQVAAQTHVRLLGLPGSN
jgi:hypothetical protein